jgi:hypothetical protein
MRLLGGRRRGGVLGMLFEGIVIRMLYNSVY